MLNSVTGLYALNARISAPRLTTSVSSTTPQWLAGRLGTTGLHTRVVK